MASNIARPSASSLTGFQITTRSPWRTVTANGVDSSGVGVSSNWELLTLPGARALFGEADAGSPQADTPNFARAVVRLPKQPKLQGGGRLGLQSVSRGRGDDYGRAAGRTGPSSVPGIAGRPPGTGIPGIPGRASIAGVASAARSASIAARASGPWSAGRSRRSGNGSRWCRGGSGRGIIASV